MGRPSFFEFLRSFADALPANYHARHDAFAVADQARTAFERGDAPLNAGPFRGVEEQGTPLCAVGSSRNAILSALSRAAVLTRFEVASAEAYTLDFDGRQEFMALFWVRHARGRAITRHEQTLLVDLLIGLGNRSVRGAHPRTRHPSPSATQVRFLEGLDGNLAVLEVETPWRSGLRSDLVDVLTTQRLKIVHCEVQCDGDRVRDRFRVVEQDGASVAPTRWLQIQVHVLDAIEGSIEPAAATA